MTRSPRENHALGLVVFLSLAGCASAPPPVGLLDDAGLAIESARSVKAEDYAAVELGRAEEQLAAARLAMDERDYAQARDLAEQAELQAQLAGARSRAAAGREKVRVSTEENARLRRELLGGRQ